MGAHLTNESTTIHYLLIYSDNSLYFAYFFCLDIFVQFLKNNMELLTKSASLLFIIYSLSTSLFPIVEGSPANTRVNNADVDCEQYPNGYKIASPTDCTEYYVCVHHIAYLFQCPITTSGRLYFNPDYKVCDW